MKTTTHFRRLVCAFAVFVSCQGAIYAEDTGFRERLAHSLPDIKRVDRIVQEFGILASKADLDEQTSEAIKEWICAKSLFLGSKFYDHNLLLKRLPALEKNKSFIKHYANFVKGIESKNTLAHWKSDANDVAKRITILFTGAYGGGHKAPAMALNSYLTQKGYTIQLIDVDEVENKYSPQINGYTKAQIYAEVYQKQNDPKKARKLNREIDKAQNIEAKIYLNDIKKQMQEFKPDHIFAVAHHKPKLAYLSYKLDVPMTYIHTDHGFNRMLFSILYEQEKLENPLVQFAMLGNDELYKAGPSVTKQLVRVDFPVRASFKPASRAQKHKLRDQLGIPRNAYVVKLAMGQNGLAKDMKRILTRMKKEQKKLKKQLHVYAVCGKNEILKKELAKFGRGKGKIRVHVLGFLEEKEMAAVDRASDLWITKPGGSTSAELLQTQKQMLYEINAAHPWEQNNANFLESMGLAKKLSRKQSIIKQIQNRIKKHSMLNLERLPQSNWQAQIDEILSK